MKTKKKIKYDWKITLKKGLKYAAVYGVPWIIQGFLNDFPTIAAMQIDPAMVGITIGSLLTMLMNYLKINRK